MTPEENGASTLSVTDRIAIRDVLLRYCVANDTKSFDDYDQVFTSDVEWDFGPFGKGVGRAEMRAGIEPLLTDAVRTQHFLGESLIEATDEGASTHSYFLFHLADAGTGNLIVTEGVMYFDDLIRTSEGWRIARRRYDPVWHQDHTPAA